MNTQLKSKICRKMKNLEDKKRKKAEEEKKSLVEDVEMTSTPPPPSSKKRKANDVSLLILIETKLELIVAKLDHLCVSVELIKTNAMVVDSEAPKAKKAKLHGAVRKSFPPCSLIIR